MIIKIPNSRSHNIIIINIVTVAVQYVAYCFNGWFLDSGETHSNPNRVLTTQAWVAWGVPGPPETPPGYGPAQ